MTIGITELPPEGMQLPGVALAGDADRGTKTTEGISLLFTTAGVTVQGPQPQIERLLVWSALDSATCREKIQLPDGREAAIMELTSGGQSIRFLLPSDAVSPGQAAYLDQALPTWLVRYKGIAAPAAPAPVAPGAESATPTQDAEVGVALPAPGPAPATTQPVTQAEVVAEAPAPAYTAAGTTGAALGAAGLAAAGLSGEHPIDPSASNGQGIVAGGTPASPPTMQAPPMQAPPAPPAPVAPVMQAPPPPPPAPTAPTMPAPTMQGPPPSPPAPAAPVMPAVPTAPAAPVMPAPPVMQTAAFATPAPPTPTGTAWDNPPLGVAAPDVSVPEPKKAKKPRFALTRKQLHAAEAAAAGAAVDPASAASQVAARAPGQAAPDVFAPEAKKTKKPRFALTRKQLHAAEAAAAGTAVVGAAAAVDPAPAVPQAGVPAPPAAVAPPSAPGTAAAPEPKKAKKPRFALTRKQLHAAEAAAAGTAVVGTAAATTAPPAAPPSDPVPLGVQPPPPVAAQNPVAAQMGQPLQAPGPPGAGDVVLADAGSKTSRRNLVLLIALLVLVVAVGTGYLISKKSNSTTTAPRATVPVGAADPALAAAINLRLTDLPTGWTQAPPAQAVVRPPVAAAAAGASNAMASCLNTSYAVVSGLFDSGSLSGQTSLVQSRMFASPAGSTLEMASRTTTMSSPGQVQALDAVFTNPKFDLCYQQYRQTLAQAAVPGASVQVQPVTLSAPTGVQSYGVVSTYTLPGAGTEVVGDAYVLGGRAVTVIQPSTDGAAIPSNAFAPAYDAVAGRVAASASK